MGFYEYQPVGETIKPRAVRPEGASVLTCAACGCRLTARESLDDGAAYGPDAAWRHFWGEGDRDARGCRVECVDKPHRTTPLEAPAA
jgi:hypothetical protein